MERHQQAGTDRTTADKRLAEDILDLTDRDPSEHASVTVERTTVREAATLTVTVRIWKATQLSFSYVVHGPRSWVSPLCAVVLFEGIAAAAFLPNLILPADGTPGLRVAIAATAGALVLMTGAGALYWLRDKS